MLRVLRPASLLTGGMVLGMLAFGWFIDKYGTKIGYAVSM